MYYKKVIVNQSTLNKITSSYKSGTNLKLQFLRTKIAIFPKGIESI